MAESNDTCFMISETDVSALKETLFAQQQLLQKLYGELDEERDASATAASEALSVILRLQGEKAAVKMEASQYKRMAEEKMCHAEESLAVFEDAIYQKEMEIASLDFQVQAYRYKLMSLGGPDLNPGDNRFMENVFFQRFNGNNNGERSSNGSIKKIKSLPPMLLKDLYQKKAMVENEKYGLPNLDFSPRSTEGNMDGKQDVEFPDSGKKAVTPRNGDFNSYGEQIRKLDVRVKEIADYKSSDKFLNLHDVASPSYSMVSCTSPCWYSARETNSNFDQDMYFSGLHRREVIDSPTVSTNVHDVFEVPQINENRKDPGLQLKDWGKSLPNVETRPGKPDVACQESLNSRTKDQAEWIKQILLSLNQDRERKPSTPKGEASIERTRSPLPQSTRMHESETELQELIERIEQLEKKESVGSHEIMHEGEEEIKLLKEIQEQLNSIQNEIRCLSIKKAPKVDNSQLILLQEAMLSWWL